MTGQNNLNIKEIIEPFGGTAFPILELTSVNTLKAPEIQRIQLEYRDLLDPRHTSGVSLPPIDGVLEIENRSFLYLIQSNKIDSSVTLSKLCDILACRGHVSYLAIIDYGKIDVYPCIFKNAADYRTEIVKNPQNALFIPDLIQREVKPEWRSNLLTPLETKDDTKIRGILKSRITTAIEKIIKNYSTEVNGKDTPLEIINLAVALVGRAIFSRFLVDRRILTATNARELHRVVNGEFRTCFDDNENASHICAWLDYIFNGEMLKIQGVVPCNLYKDWVEQYRSFFSKKLNGLDKVLEPLQCFMRLADRDGQLPLWELINFFHVPVGLLSEVYEEVAWKFLSSDAQKHSQFYTPEHIARFMVDQAFEAIPKGKRFRTKLLDPTAGAGIFLVLCLRRLVFERWLKDGIRPTTDTIRDIIYDQLRGFEINSHAINMATLSLYLMAIELDPDPESPPVNKLRFPKPFLNNVLFNVKDKHILKIKDKDHEFVLGCLGEKVPPDFDGQFDLVIGNPPWTKQNHNKFLDDKANEIAKRVIENRIKPSSVSPQSHEAIEYVNPDFNPDLPVLWRSMEWTKKGGTIALIMHARHLFKQSKKGRSAREAIFSALRATGIVNCTDLRETNVWPQIKAPFFLLFAKNEVPNKNDLFNYISPYIERNINREGRFRIDSKRVHWINFSEIKEYPWILRALFRGTTLDLQLVKKFQGEKKHLIFLEDYLGDMLKLDKPYFKTGFRLGDKEENRNRSAFVIISKEAKLYTHKQHKDTNILIKSKTLPNFIYKKVDFSREVEIYAPPLLLRKEAMTFSGRDCALALDNKYIAYSRNFYGISAATYQGTFEDKLIFLSYLYLIFSSSLCDYLLLMKSSKLGIERDTIYIEDLLNLPVIPISKLTIGSKKELEHITKEYILTDRKPDQIIVDKFVANIYQLSSADLQIISDTLAVSLPSYRHKSFSQDPPSDNQIKTFCLVLAENLNSIIKNSRDKIKVTPADEPDYLQRVWRFVDISQNSLSNYNFSQLLSKMTEKLANEYGASMMTFKLGQNRIRLGLLAQNRYWTATYARLCTYDVIDKLEH